MQLKTNKTSINDITAKRAEGFNRFTIHIGANEEYVGLWLGEGKRFVPHFPAQYYLTIKQFKDLYLICEGLSKKRVNPLIRTHNQH